MKFKAYLKNLIETKRNKMMDLQKRSDAAEDINEVRSIGEQLKTLRDEITEAEKQLEDLPDDAGEGDSGTGDGGADGAARSIVPQGAEYRNANIIASFAQGNTPDNTRGNDPYDTMEYRNAYMEFVCRGKKIPTELRATTTTTDTKAVIPTTILNEMIKELKTYGNIWNKVKKINVQGGVKIPILSLKPEAKWIGETEKAEDQKLSANESISFTFYGLECKIAQSLLVSVTTLAMFQEIFIPLAVEAMTYALEIAIINGNGTNQPLGILKDSRIPTENIIVMTDEDVKSFSQWKKKVFSKMKKSYRKGDFIMAQGTFDGYIDGMVDTTGQPIGRVNYGINGEEAYRFGGKNIETVEDDIIKPYETAEEGDVFAIFVDLSNYIINTNMEMQTVKWTDNDTNEVKNKCILTCDGKIVDARGVLIIKKGTKITV